jgi:hypothetical protein
LTEKEDQVFVISQIGSEGSHVRKRADVIVDYIVAPVAAEFSLRAQRSDRDPTLGPITSRLLRSILRSRIVVADLTGQNANVFYELCFAHSFGLPVVILVDKTENLPFDVKNERVIDLGDHGSIDMEQGEKAKTKLREAFQVVLNEDYKPNSLVTEVAGVQNIESLSPEDPVASELAAIKQRVDAIYSSVSTSNRGSSGYHASDVTNLMALVERLIEDGTASRQDLSGLINEHTSTRFDDWVRRMRNLAQGPAAEDEFDDIPF